MKQLGLAFPSKVVLFSSSLRDTALLSSPLRYCAVQRTRTLNPSDTAGEVYSQALVAERLMTNTVSRVAPQVQRLSALSLVKETSVDCHSYATLDPAVPLLCLPEVSSGACGKA